MSKSTRWFDQSFSEKNLYRLLDKSDFRLHPALYNDEKKQALVREATHVAQSGLKTPLRLVTWRRNGKDVHKLKEFSEELVVRKAQENFKTVMGISQSNRDSIVRNILCLLEEGVPYRIYRLDISAFYESVDTTSLMADISQDLAISRNSRFVLDSLFRGCRAFGIAGLPRGFPASAILSEYYMRRFDQTASVNKHVFFYARFVDDILIITDSEEDQATLVNHLEAALPKGLQFNARKEEIVNAPRVEGDNNCVADFNYLGYRFRAVNPASKKNASPRKVLVDISGNKIKKLKTKLVRSLLAFCVNHDFELLHDRIKALAGNYSIKDRKTGGIRNTGIYFDYKFVTFEESYALAELDSFLKKAVLSNSGVVFSRASKLLAPSQKRTLLQNTFSNGFRKRIFHHFGASQLAAIQRCWQYG